MRALIFAAALAFSSPAAAQPSYTWDVKMIVNSKLGKVCEASTSNLKVDVFGSNLNATIALKGVDLGPDNLHTAADLTFSNGAKVHTPLAVITHEGIVTSFSSNSVAAIKAITASTRVTYQDSKATVGMDIPDPKDLAEGLHECLAHAG